MKNKYILPILLLFSLLIRLALGIITGGASTDASDYTTWAIQIINQSNYSELIDLHSPRQIVNIWVSILVLFMQIFGATNFTAIFTTALLGTLSIYFFYKIVSLYTDFNNAIAVTILYSLNPVHLCISHNSFYDTILLSLLLSSLYFYFNFFKSNNLVHLIISGTLISITSLIHATGYFYIFALWVVFPFFFNKKKPIKHWAIFTLTISLIPIIQMLIWKQTLNSFLPYQKLNQNWRIYDDELNLNTTTYKDYIKYIFYLILAHTPILFSAFMCFLFDVKKSSKKSKWLILLFFILLLYFFSQKSNVDLLSPLLLIFSFTYMFLLKKDLKKENIILFTFGLLALIIFTLYIRTIPNGKWGIRQFIYPNTFLIPILYYYMSKFFKKIKIKLLIVLGCYFVLFLFGYLFSIPRFQTIKTPFVKGTYYSAFQYFLPYYNHSANEIEVYNWLKDKTSKNDFIFTNYSSRYLCARLNLPQNHFSMIFDNYSHEHGFSRKNINEYLEWIMTNKPKYIVWDSDFKTYDNPPNFDINNIYNSVSSMYVKEIMSNNNISVLKLKN